MSEITFTVTIRVNAVPVKAQKAKRNKLPTKAKTQKTKKNAKKEQKNMPEQKTQEKEEVPRVYAIWEKLEMPLFHPRKTVANTPTKYGEKRLIKGTEEYEERKADLDRELDFIQRELEMKAAMMEAEIKRRQKFTQPSAFKEMVVKPDLSELYRLAAIGAKVEEENQKKVPEAEMTRQPKYGRKDRNYPQGPMSGYMAYGKVRRPQLAVADPFMPFGDMTKKISQEWNAMSPEEKEPYTKVAAADKERYLREKAEYQKSPLPKKPAKPMTASRCFVVERIGKSTISDPISVEDLEEEWNCMSDTQKSRYNGLAMQDQLRYQRQLEEYQARK